MTGSRGIRLTDARYVELKTEMQELRARLDRYETREDAGSLLAELVGGACLTTLKRHPRQPVQPRTKGHSL